MFFGYYSLIVYEIQAIYITLFLRNRDLITTYCCFTHLLSEISNYALKHILRVSRPEGGPPGGGLFEGRYGMPSQHCHCFAYLFTMILLLTFHYYRAHIDLSKKLLTAIISLTALALQILGRIYLKYHTLSQCLAGVGFGSLMAIIFYSLGLKLFFPFFNDLCTIAPLRFFSFRKDLVTDQPTSSYQKNKIQYRKVKNK